MYNSIGIKEIDRININTENLLIDIRDKYEYLLSHIKYAINIPYTYILTFPDKYLDFNKTYYIYCECGSKSKKAVDYLSKMGYKVIDLIGGYREYIDDK